MLARCFYGQKGSWCQSSEKHWSFRCWRGDNCSLVHCVSVASWRIQKMCSRKSSLYCLSAWQTQTLQYAVIHRHANLWTCTLTVKVDDSFAFLLSLIRVWLSAIAGDSGGACGDPGTPAHASREAGTFKVRSKVRFTCAVGHTLYGSAERICFPNGTWSGRQPFCKRKGNL